MPNTARAEARVDLSAVEHNAARLRHGSGNAAVMAVVKADGYGHGMVACAGAALRGGATWLGVALVSEALTLRDAGVDAPLLVLMPPDVGLADAVAAGVDLAVHSPDDLARVADAGASGARSPRIHLKVDTGLGRGGWPAREWPQLLVEAARAEAAGRLRVVGLWSHLAYADQPRHPSVALQVEVFADAVEAAEKAGLTPEVRHLANSAATFALPEAHWDLVRPGIALYGLSPGPEVGAPSALGLRPAMTLVGRVALVKRLPAGHGVSYGHRYVTTDDTTVAVVPLGYADGVPRAASGVAEVWLAGRRRRIAGSVCMDQFVVDVGADTVSPGDEVVLFGPGDDGEPTAEDWAGAVGTIGYEIVTRVGARVPRVYAGGEP